jgi:hypothetical protein
VERSRSHLGALKKCYEEVTYLSQQSHLLRCKKEELGPLVGKFPQFKVFTNSSLSNPGIHIIIKIRLLIGFKLFRKYVGESESKGNFEIAQ